MQKRPLQNTQEVLISLSPHDLISHIKQFVLHILILPDTGSICDAMPAVYGISCGCNSSGAEIDIIIFAIELVVKYHLLLSHQANLYSAGRIERERERWLPAVAIS